MIKPEWEPYLNELLERMPSDGWELHKWFTPSRHSRRTLRRGTQILECPISSLEGRVAAEYLNVGHRSHFPYEFVREIAFAADENEFHDPHLRKLLLHRAGLSES